MSKSRLFQRLAPRYAKDFWPFPVLDMGIARSVLEILNSLGCTPDNLTNRPLRYLGAREFGQKVQKVCVTKVMSLSHHFLQFHSGWMLPCLP